MMPLGLLGTGEQGEIVLIRGEREDSCCGAACGTDCCGHGQKQQVRIEDLGLRIGKTVEMLNNGSGPLLLRIDESRIALARALAMKIMVQRAS